MAFQLLPRTVAAVSWTRGLAMWLSGSDFEECGLDKKRTVLLLRSVVVVSLGYLVLFASPDPSTPSVAYTLALILSNAVLAALPAEAFRRPQFSKGLFLADTAGVLAGLYCTVGLPQDFLIVYFFTMFLTAAVETVGQIAVGAIIVSAVYGCWLWATSAAGPGSGEWLRLPFFFIVAVFYAYMTEEVKRERARRLHAERESQHLRFLLNLGDAFSGGHANRDLVRQVGTVVEAAFPRLTCTASSKLPATDGGNTWFPMRAQGATFGGLQVTTKDKGALSSDEEQFCRVAALVAANALYAAQQADAAGSSARLKEEFLGTLSHELRTPLHAILGYIELLDWALPQSGNRVACESIQRLRANTSRLQGLLEEMLWFADLRSGQRAVHREQFDVREMFDRFAASMAIELAGRPIRFERCVEADVPGLYTDQRKVNHIVGSLLSNAAKFTEQGYIRLTARRLPGGYVEIAVRDSGIGIDPKDFAAIFEEFRQLDASLTRRVGGLGLGLALAQELAATLGGSVTVESQPGCGATFRVRLPLEGAQTAHEIQAVAPAHPGVDVCHAAA